MAGGPDGIEGALNEYIKESLPAKQECEAFETAFVGFSETIAKLRSEGGFTGVIPVEVKDALVDTGALVKIKDDFDKGTIDVGPDKTTFRVPVLGIRDGKLTIVIYEYDKARKTSAAPIKAGVQAIGEMLKYLHASPERPAKYPNVYEFIKAFILVFGKGEKPHVNPARVDAFLDVAPCALAERIVEQAYKSAFREGKTQTIIKGIMGINGVTEDNFRDWFDSFKPKRHEAKLAESLAAIVKEKDADAIEKAKKQFLSRMLDKNPASHDAVLGSEFPMPLKKIMQQYDETGESKSLAAEIPKRATDRIDAYAGDTSVSVSKVINIGSTDERVESSGLSEKEKKDARAILETLAAKMNSFRRGMKFSFRHYSSICELIFGDSIDWVKPKKINWNILFNEGYGQMFKEMNAGKDEDLYFLDEVYQIRVLLQNKGLRNNAARELFIKELPLKTSTNE